MLKCTTNKYEKLYAPWIIKGGDLLGWAGMERGATVLDLCGGSGAVAIGALSRGAGEVHLLDLNPRCTDPNVKQFEGKAEQAYGILPDHYYDLVVCRQAINYLNLFWTLLSVKGLLKPGGQFVFNTFLRPRWALRAYRHTGSSYLEASACLGKHVLHLQASPLIGADLSYFRWYKQGKIEDEILRRFKHMRSEFSGRSVRFRCWD